MRTYLLFTCLCATQAIRAGTDTLYMKPCFMIEYPSKWSGASSNESNWRMDGDGSRFMDWRYLYPGSTVTATLHDGNRDISIETSYKHLLRKKPKVVNDLEYDYNYGRNYSYDVTDKVVETTYETFNGFTYKIEYVSRTYVNSKNKVKRSFFYNAQCDTSFSNHYYLAIETTEWSKDKKKLTNRLAGVKISHIAPSALDDMYARHFDEPAFRSATVRSFEHWKKQFMQYTYNQLSCTSAESVHSWTMERISEDSVVDLLAQFNYKLLADVIVEHHEKFVHLANDTYFDYVYKWKYSLEYEYNKYKLIGEGKADINHFLNYLDDDSTATFIDTLDAFRILRNNTAQQINESLEADEWDEYFDQYKEKRSSLVEQQFIRQFSIQNLEGDPLLQYKYRKVLDEPGNKIYLFLPSANYALHSVLGIFTRQPDNTWKYELDQLEFNAEADGEQDFTPFNNAFGILGKSNCLVLDTAGTGVQLHKLFVSYEYFSRYPFIWIVGDAQDDLPHGFALNPYHNEIFYHMLDSTEIVGMKFTKEIDVEKKLPTNGSYYDDSYYYNRTYDYNLERTEAQRRMKTDALTTQNLQKLAPWRILYHQPFATADLDGDGITELFTYDISAGKVERQQCYTMRSGALTRLPDEEAKTLLANSQRFQNLMHYSAMGNKKK